MTEGLLRLAAALDRAIEAEKAAEAGVSQKPAAARRRAGDHRRRQRRKAGAAGARLVAVQMALAGHSRRAAEERLTSSVPSRDLKTILDDVFGATPKP
jgi:hypothetical protein